jgi:hypothetical protein
MSGQSKPWLRLYRDALHHPKIVTLSDRQHRVWHNCLLIADDDGRLPCMRDIAVHLRMACAEAEQAISELVEAQLVDVETIDSASRTYRMHNWEKRQFTSDSSTARSRKSREKKKCNTDATLQQRPGDGDATAPDFRLQTSDTDSESFVPTSEQEAAREKVEQRIDFGFRKGKAGGDWETILSRAEGLGLPVAELAEQANGAKTSREGYLLTLCVNRLRSKLPNVKDAILRDALKGKTAAWTMVVAAMSFAEVA